MKFEFIKNNRSTVSVKKMCSFLEVSESGYYDWLVRRPSQREIENKNLLFEIKEIYHKNRKVYGSPRIADALNESRSDDKKIGENRVARIMKNNFISGNMKSSFKVQTTDSNHDKRISPNLLDQEFQAELPNQVWLSDITYIRTGEGFGYLCAIKDLYDERIVGWSFEKHMRTELVLKAFRKAVFSRQVHGKLIFHSDRGVQYASDEFRKELNLFGLTQSMSGKGNCYDNAPLESFFGALKTELVFHQQYATRAETR